MGRKPKTEEMVAAWRARASARNPAIQLGLMAVAGDEIAGTELRLLLAQRKVKLFVAHVPAMSEGALANPAATIDDIVSAAKWLALGQPLAAIAYAGTLATITMGEERIGRSLGEARPGVPWTTPITAAVAALVRLAIRRIVLLSPYSASSHRVLAAYLRGRGFEIVEDAHLDLGEDGSDAVLSESVLLSRLLDLKWAEAQAILICGTSLRAASLIASLEDSTGLPVVTAGQALAWHCLRLTGDDRPIAGFGRLLRSPGLTAPVDGS